MQEVANMLAGIAIHREEDWRKVNCEARVGSGPVEATDLHRAVVYLLRQHSTSSVINQAIEQHPMALSLDS